jgi:hygromycin-B 7''-O-kinase
MAPFPSSLNEEEFRHWRSARSRWTPTVLEIVWRRSLPQASPEGFPTGTNLIVALDCKSAWVWKPISATSA